MYGTDLHPGFMKERDRFQDVTHVSDVILVTCVRETRDTFYVRSCEGYQLI
jgi:hypothetical protein